jgi:hypothetical protein
MKEETYIDKVSGRTLYVVENPDKATHFQYNTTFTKILNIQLSIVKMVQLLLSRIGLKNGIVIISCTA